MMVLFWCRSLGLFFGEGLSLEICITGPVGRGNC